MKGDIVIERWMSRAEKKKQRKREGLAHRSDSDVDDADDADADDAVSA